MRNRRPHGLAHRAGLSRRRWAPTHRKIADLIEALGAILILRDDVSPPCWLNGRKSGVIALAEAHRIDEVTCPNVSSYSMARTWQTS
jgi:hypothetical protein